MRISMIALTAALALSQVGLAHAAAPADVYGNLPEISRARLSPGGTFAAMVQPLGGSGGVTIYRIGAGAGVQPCVFAPKDVRIEGIYWPNDDRLVVNVSLVRQGPEERYPRKYVRAVSITNTCLAPVQLMNDQESFGQNQNAATYIGRIPGDDRHVLMAAYSGGWADTPSGRISRPQYAPNDVFKVNIETGKTTLYQSGTGTTIGWTVDTQGVVRVRTEIDLKDGATLVFSRESASGSWKQIYRGAGVRESDDLDVLGFGDDPTKLIISMRRGDDRIGVYTMDVNSGAISDAPLLADPVFDMPARLDGFPLFDVFQNKIIGMFVYRDQMQAIYFNPEWQRLGQTLSASFDNETFRVESFTRDLSKMLVYVEGAQDPGGTYYFLDRKANEITKVGARYPKLTPADLARVQTVTYKARDGLELRGYLTIPPGASAKNLPLVVIPHGGPAARDTADFDWWAQFVATRGYLVFQPQFRGSAGFGRKFERAGDFKWGLEMQNDITDGVQYLVAQGMVDAKRVCINGWSYGGYATMAGVAFSPEVYKCGVAGAGVSDLLTMLGYERNHEGMTFGDLSYWPRVIGDPTRDRDRLIKTSPARHAAKVTAALMLVHGDQDTIVPLDQSQQMQKAMQAAGKPAELVILRGEDHNISRSETRTEYLRALERFLAQHLK